MLSPSWNHYYDSVCRARGHDHGPDGIRDCMLDQFAILRVQERRLKVPSGRLT